MHSHRLSSSSFSVSPPPSPQPQATTTSKSSRSDQIVQSFYGKAVQIILQSRITLPLISKDKNLNNQGIHRNIRKQNRWFNIETEEVEEYRNETRYWRNASISEDPAPPLFLEIYIDTSELTPNQIIVLVDGDKNKHKIDLSKGDNALYFKGLSPNNSKKTILLESWKIELDKTSRDCVLELPTIYKYGIAFFRSLYLYTRLLPCFELFQRLKKVKSSGIKLGYRMTVSSTSSAHEIGFDSEHFSEGSNLKIGTNSFEPLITPLGSLKLSVTSRVNCNFYKEDGEKLLSAKFQDLDARISNIKEDSFSPQKAFTHRRFSSHGDILNKSPLTYNPGSSLQPQIVKSPDDLGDSPVSSSTSADSSNINRSSNSDIQVNNIKQKFSSNKDILSKDYDSKSLPRGSSGKNIPIFASMRSSPPSHVTSALRRPPSLSSFSPFKSPSLSSSPSLHNISPPSKNSSFGNRSVTSLERGIHLSTAKATPITVRPSSPAPSKLSSSFGHRFGSISENPNSQDYAPSPSSLSRRNLSIRNSGFFERNSASSGANIMNVSFDSNKYMSDLSAFINFISDPPLINTSTKRAENVILKNPKELLDEFKVISLNLSKLREEMENYISAYQIEDGSPSYNANIVSSPLLQTGFKAEDLNISQPLKIPKSSLSKGLTSTHNSLSIPVSPRSRQGSSDPTSFSFPEARMQKSSLLSQKLNNQQSKESTAVQEKMIESSLKGDW